MNQYCYNLEGDLTRVNPEEIKKFVRNLYKNNKYEDLSFIDEKEPFIVLYSAKDHQVCIKMTSRAKKNIERVEELQKKFKPKDLQINTYLHLSKPFLFKVEQCAWWDKGCKLTGGKKWATLEHHGPYFVHLMEPYLAHGAPIIYDGKKYSLTPEEEQIASFYARRIISEKAGNVTQLWTKDKTFNQNFWNDFKTYLTPEHKKIFKDFSKFNFSPIVKKLEQLKEKEQGASEKEKSLKKTRAAEKKQSYGYAIINGTLEPLGNFTIEPAAIFYGRGENPKRGKVKRSIEPEEVTINIGKEAKIPEAPEGHKWKEVISNQDLAWVASWKDPISGETKYVYFAAESQLKGKSDLYKYEKARKLNRYIDEVREKYTADLESKNPKLRQLGTVLYLIDHYGLRVGNEKDTDETDTVGASTLRVEHVKLKPPETVIFDFLGKDSVRFYKEIQVSPEVFKNFESFLKGKKPEAQVFDLISAADINSYLKSFDKDFTAKVFRTRLASTLMNKDLRKIKLKKNATPEEKKQAFLKANVEVAKVLNHQRTVSEKSKEILKKYQKELKELRSELKEAKAEKKSTKTIETKIRKKQDQIAVKKNTLNIAVNTSLANYIDPRIVVSWTKAHDLSVAKVYPATLQRKFKWAIDTTGDDWNYETSPLAPEMKKLQPAEKVTSTPTPKPKPKFTPKKITEIAPIKEAHPAIFIINYSPKSIAVLGDTKGIKEQLKELGGRFNPRLTVDGDKVAGWIFSKKRTKEVQKLLPTVEFKEGETTVKPKEIKKTFTDIMSDHNLSLKERNIIRCFARDPKVVQYLQKSLLNSDVYRTEFLSRFLACLETVDKNEQQQANVIQKYKSLSRSELVNKLAPQLLPSSVPTYMFLIYILYKVSSRWRETYLQGLVQNISNEKDIQKCLCDNSNQESIMGDVIEEVPMNDLYLLPSGRCIPLEELIMHLKTSPNKIQDPTYNPIEDKGKPSLLWYSGWELQAMLKRIKSYNYSQGTEIAKDFHKVFSELADVIPAKTKEMVNDLYGLFYFPEDTKQHIIKMLVKYGYPTGEGKGNLSTAQSVYSAGTSPALNEFRTLLGFRLGHHIMEELDKEQRDAVLFIGEFAGMGKEAWGKLSMGEFCTKTFGAILHRMADILAGKYNVF